MQPLTRETLAGNAYRTLGLAGTATQSAVDAAARRMRIWADPRSIPPTPWDLLWLGSLDRSRRGLEQAVARLNQPASRLREQLLWYHAPLTPEPPRGDVVGRARSHAGNGSESPTCRHDRALAALHAASVSDPNETRCWNATVVQWAMVWESPDTQAWLRAVDAAGSYEKPATDREIQAAVEDLPRDLAEALVLRAVAAREQHQWETLDGLIEVLALPELARAAPASLSSLASRLEDALEAGAVAMDRELRDGLTTNHKNPEPYYAANRALAVQYHAAYSRDIQPLLKRVCKASALIDGDEDRATRTKARCGSLLALIALGWEWCGAPLTAEKALLEAIELVRGTQAELTINADLARVTALADEWRRQHAEVLAAAPPPPSLAEAVLPSPAPASAPPAPPSVIWPLEERETPWWKIVLAFVLVFLLFYVIAWIRDRH